jgi:glycosyltransferase involved in cell wall biosynthesis
MIKLPDKRRTLIFSQRNIFAKALFRCSLYEFENIISEIDSVELLAPPADLSTFRYSLAKRLAYHAPIALSPDRNHIHLKADYDLFLAICGHPTDLLMLKGVSNWRYRCKTAVCLIDELWVNQLDNHRYFLEALKQFDVVILYYSNTVKPLSERIGRKCVFVPPGVDAIRFCPYPQLPQRLIDVCSIGRRSEITHRRLLSMADEEGLFYLHDTIAGDQAIHSSEHRALMANVAKRSRYFIVNPGLIDRPDLRGNQVEVGNRYFEGSAAGAILLGERPGNEIFGKLFDWPDALIHLPYDSAKVDEIIHEFDMQPERQETMRRTNVAQALLRHDWVYRWESILEAVDLEAMPQLLKRKERLRSMSEAVTGSGARHITTT